MDIQINTLEQYINLYGIIYEIKNKINNKRYIGQTTKNNLDERSRWTVYGLKKE